MKPKILVVEDDTDLQQVLGIRLKAAGFDVLSAQDGTSAFSTALKQSPDIVLLDLGLPAGDGYTVLRRLKESSKTSTAPVIVLSARDAAENRPKALEAGADDYLSKPVDPRDLVETLKRHLPEGALQAGAAAAPASGAPSPPARGAKVVLVEDDEDLRRAVEIRLKAEGFVVAAVADATNAVRTVRTHEADVVVLDLGLPGGGGMFVLEALKANTQLSSIPVIVLSARDKESASPAALAAGAVEYLQKPAEPADLAAAIRRVLAPV